MRCTLGVILVAFSFVTEAVPTISEERELCRTASYSESAVARGEIWTPIRDEKVQAYAREFLRNLSPPITHTVVCTTMSKTPEPAWSRSIRRGWEKDTVFVVGISPHFSAQLETSLRAIIAHEVGHLVNPNSVSCARYRGLRMNQDYVYCEHDADWAAMNWVGRQTMVRALREISVYMEREGYSEDKKENMRARIQLLERAP